MIAKTWPAATNLFWIALYLAIITAPLIVMLAVPGAGGGFLWDLSMALGFAGLMVMGVQFALTARFRRATAPYGIDIIYYFHRYAGLVGFAAILAHPALLIVNEPAYRAFLDPRTSPPHMVAGVASVAALSLLMATSLLRKPLRIHYDAWRFMHLALAIATVALAIFHVHEVGYYSALPPMRVSGFIAVTGWVALVLWVRLVRPWLVMRNPFRVIEVRAERGDAWTLALEPAGGREFHFQPGQFAWLTLRRSPFSMRDHPFSIASSPVTPRRVEVTIKELGDFTRTIRDVRRGEAAYLDGPYGAFSIDRYAAAGFVFVAGGIGIAPIMSMVRTLAARCDPRPALLFYAYRRWERLTFREELDELASRSRLTVVYVLEEPPADWAGERGRVTAELLDRRLPAAREGLEYFICGPEPMIAAVESALHRLGVPMSRYHSELFDLV